MNTVNRLIVPWLRACGVKSREIPSVRVLQHCNTRKCTRNIATSSWLKDSDNRDKEVVVFQDIFNSAEEKSKETFLDMIKIYQNQSIYRRGHVEFIYTALKHMEEFGVDDEREVYKALIDILPKGKFVPTNIYQAEFMHYPKQQQCIIDVLDTMESKGVIPDEEMQDMLINIFGRRGHPVRKYWRMMYWMPKFKNLSPWPVPKKVTNDALELAKMAIARMLDVDLQAKIDVYDSNDVSDSIDKTWIVSGQSPKQIELLNKRPKDRPVFIEGPFLVWLRYRCVNYFIMRADYLPTKNDLAQVDEDDVTRIDTSVYRNKSLIPEISVHEQKDGVILGLVATGTSSKDSLLSWVRLLQQNGNKALGELPVVFKLRQSSKEIAPIVTSSETQVK